jgi:DNA-binding SARP family transcriptional activator
MMAISSASSSGHRARPPVMASKVQVPLAPLLVRARLNDALDPIWNHRLGLVVAPAGSGKTSLLVQLALSQSAPVAWCRVEVSERDASAFLAHVGTALAAPLGAPPTGSSVEDVIRAVESFRGSRLLLIIDDLHVLEGSNAEQALQRLVDCAPPTLSMLAAARRPPSLNLSRLRVSGRLLEITADHLRFRTWEVERLFKDFYQEPLPPEDLADLTRRTEGWAAGLQLFHLATAGKPPEERRRAVASLGSRRLLRDYLADNVLAGLPKELRDFLVGTCVLGRLTGPLCDELLDTAGSRAVLQEIELRQIFIHELDEGTYRYHEVLHSYLEGVLVDQVGETEARARYRRAGALLERAGFFPEALRAFCRGEDWRSADRLLGGRGVQLLGHGMTWIDALPRALVDQDPWLVLVTARRRLVSGRLAAAVAAYRQAEAAFGAAGAAEVCRRERRVARLWLDPAPVALLDPPEWPDVLRAAVRRLPLAARERAARLPGPTGRLVEGLAFLLAGHGSDAQRLLAEAAGSPGASAATATAARVAMALVTLPVDGSPWLTAEVERAATDADELGLCWIAKLGRAGLALSDRAEGVAEAAAVRRQCQDEGDAWGEACAGLLEAIGTIKAGSDAVALVEAGVDRFRRLGGGSLEAWSRSLLALAMARAGHPEAKQAAVQAEAFARSAGVGGARGLAFGVLAVHAAGRARAELLATSRAIAEDADWMWERLLHALPDPAGSPSRMDDDRRYPGVQIRCFGGFALLRSGKAVDLAAVKPRARAALRFLAARAGRGVHREELMEALWPGLSPSSAIRNLHVAISAVRRCLEPDAPRGTSSLLVRDGDTYRLRLDEADLDVGNFERAVAEARAARIEGDVDRSREALETALAVYRGDLLPEDGPSEWVVEHRERFRLEATDAAASLAELELRRRPEKAVEACWRGLSIDRYRDDLWRLLTEAHSRAGDRAATARAAREYQAVLAELGLPVASGSPG